MRLDRLKSFALALQQTTVVKQWSECLVFKVVGKMFRTIFLDGEVIDRAAKDGLAARKTLGSLPP